MSDLRPVRGVQDIMPETMRVHAHVTDRAREVALRSGFHEIATPIFEFTRVFERTLGDTSDIVTKEMYTFEDKGGDSLTLRPENTAGIARAFISGGLRRNIPWKVFYAGPMFRRERPQKGRLRQFHQVGVELIGVDKPLADIEVVALGRRLLADLGLEDKTTLEINTLGDQKSRDAYRVTLVDYLSANKDGLSEDSLDRLGKNPLRILDSKNEGDRAIVAGAPIMRDSMTGDARAYFDAVLDGLEKLSIPYRVNEKLVRGLDYYCHTAFEFTTNLLGAQSAVLAGGRYDGLVSLMGGPRTPGIGWAAGVERLAMLMGDRVPKAPRPIVFIPMGEAAETEAMVFAHRLRGAGFVVDLGYGGTMRKRLDRANKVNARVAIIIGEDELARGEATLRDMETGEQVAVPLDIAAMTNALDPYR